MKSFWLATCLLVPTAGFAIASTGHDDKAKAGAKQESPATVLIEKWHKAAKDMAAMPAEKKATVEKAHATLAGSCPVCKEGPAAFAFLGKFYDATVALDAAFSAECEKAHAGKDAPKPPAEMAELFEKRVHVGAQSQQLYAAFSSAMGPPEAKAADASHAKITVADAAKTFDAISAEAEKLTATWTGIPAKAAALPAEKKKELLDAMALLKKELTTCDLAMETMGELQGEAEQLASIDKMISQHCEAAAKAGEAETKTPEYAQAKAAGEARAKATAKVAALIGVMRKTMTPDIFQAKAGTMVGGSGQ